ncbi:MAG: hypothetical protein JSV67_03365 [Thermoplasmatales archaeon]|nr:MAG: hypothetical protein JSV67_03365 [Thermoplasmatales archaeon]
MNRYNSGFREPPWVMGSPKEVMEWVEASHPGKKIDDKHKFEKNYLTNLHIKFDFDVDHTIVKSSSLLGRIIGLYNVEEDFELFPTAKLILRGLAKAKFRNTAKIVVDSKVIYEHPEKKSDLRKTIDDFGIFSNEISKGKILEITAILDDVEKSTAVIKIKKIHSKKEHSVDIQIKGKIRSDIYHTFLNYLNENIGLKEN